MDIDTLTRQAREADDAARRARERLVDSVRAASREGMSQRDIARATGRSQPEVHRLLHFHGTSPGARALRRATPRIREVLDEHNFSNPRVFGSVARGSDSEGSDVDLLVSSSRPPSLLELSRVEQELTEAVGKPVDLVLDDGIRSDLVDAVLDSAIPL